MAGRRRQRELAIQLGYALEITGDGFDDALFRFTAQEPKRQRDFGDFAAILVRQMLARREEIDTRLRQALTNWRLERLSAIDRVILRLAVSEILSCPDIPLRATINEFVELSHAFGNDESPAFVNGILDTIGRDFLEKDFEAPPREADDPGEEE